MQFIDLKTQQSRIHQKLEAQVLQVFDHDQYIMGPEVKELEQKPPDFCPLTTGIYAPSTKT
jgi:UDP-2-acetamido-2-deoxy-ribo-hexuluronate aminotransferase